MSSFHRVSANNRSGRLSERLEQVRKRQPRSTMSASGASRTSATSETTSTGYGSSSVGAINWRGTGRHGASPPLQETSGHSSMGNGDPSPSDTRMNGTESAHEVGSPSDAVSPNDEPSWRKQYPPLAAKEQGSNAKTPPWVKQLKKTPPPSSPIEEPMNQQSTTPKASKPRVGNRPANSWMRPASPEASTHDGNEPQSELQDDLHTNPSDEVGSEPSRPNPWQRQRTQRSRAPPPPPPPPPQNQPAPWQRPSTNSSSATSSSGNVSHRIATAPSDEVGSDVGSPPWKRPQTVSRRISTPPSDEVGSDVGSPPWRRPQTSTQPKSPSWQRLKTPEERQQVPSWQRAQNTAEQTPPSVDSKASPVGNRRSPLTSSHVSSGTPSDEGGKSTSPWLGNHKLKPVSNRKVENGGNPLPSWKKKLMEQQRREKESAENNVAETETSEVSETKTQQSVAHSRSPPLDRPKSVPPTYQRPSWVRDQVGDTADNINPEQQQSVAEPAKRERQVPSWKKNQLSNNGRSESAEKQQSPWSRSRSTTQPTYIASYTSPASTQERNQHPQEAEVAPDVPSTQSDTQRGGAVIETPPPVNVASLRASFGSGTKTPTQELGKSPPTSSGRPQTPTNSWRSNRQAPSWLKPQTSPHTEGQPPSAVARTHSWSRLPQSSDGKPSWARQKPSETGEDQVKGKEGDSHGKSQTLKEKLSSLANPISPLSDDEKETTSGSTSKADSISLVQMAADSVLITDFQQLGNAGTGSEEDGSLVSSGVGKATPARSELPAEFQAIMEQDTFQSFSSFPTVDSDSPDETMTPEQEQHRQQHYLSGRTLEADRFPRLAPSQSDSEAYSTSAREVERFYALSRDAPDASPIPTPRLVPSTKDSEAYSAPDSSPPRSPSFEDRLRRRTAFERYNGTVNSQMSPRAPVNDDSPTWAALDRIRNSQSGSDVDTSAASSSVLIGINFDTSVDEPSGLLDSSALDSSGASSSAIFGVPTSFGSAGGDVQEEAPRVVERAKAIADWKGGRNDVPQPLTASDEIELALEAQLTQTENVVLQKVGERRSVRFRDPPDPKISTNEDAKSDVVFGDPDTYGTAGGMKEAEPPNIIARAGSVEEWKGGIVDPSVSNEEEQKVSTDQTAMGASNVLRYFANGDGVDEAEWADKDPELSSTLDNMSSVSEEQENDAEALKAWHKKSPTAASPTGSPKKSPTSSSPTSSPKKSAPASSSIGSPKKSPRKQVSFEPNLSPPRSPEDTYSKSIKQFFPEASSASKSSNKAFDPFSMDEETVQVETTRPRRKVFFPDSPTSDKAEKSPSKPILLQPPRSKSASSASRARRLREASRDYNAHYADLVGASIPLDPHEV